MSTTVQIHYRGREIPVSIGDFLKSDLPFVTLDIGEASDTRVILYMDDIQAIRQFAFDIVNALPMPTKEDVR